MARYYRRVGRRGRVSAIEHPFVAWLNRRRSSLAAWARDHLLSVELVRTWIAQPPRVRRIPREWADTIAEEGGPPATRETWPHGIREPGMPRRPLDY